MRKMAFASRCVIEPVTDVFVPLDSTSTQAEQLLSSLNETKHSFITQHASGGITAAFNLAAQLCEEGDICDA
jgi:hypothetical protein